VDIYRCAHNGQHPYLLSIRPDGHEMTLTKNLQILLQRHKHLRLRWRQLGRGNERKRNGCSSLFARRQPGIGNRGDGTSRLREPRPLGGLGRLCWILSWSRHTYVVSEADTRRRLSRPALTFLYVRHSARYGSIGALLSITARNGAARAHGYRCRSYRQPTDVSGRVGSIPRASIVRSGRISVF
jgi:hypothetical protein